MDNEALIRRWFEEVWTKGRVEVIDEMFPAHGIAHGLAEGDDLRGPEAFKVFHKQFREAFPDMQVLIEDTIAQGDRVAVRFVVQGTHAGDTLGIPATGKKVRCTGMTFARFKEGQIVEGWNNVDIASLLEQIRVA